MIKCVAFDLDGVLISSDSSFQMFESEHGITRDDFMQFFSGPYRRAMIGSCDLYDVLPAALRKWKWTGTSEQFCDVWFESCCECDPEMEREVLRLQAAGIRCCLATNQDNRRAAFLQEQESLCDLFSELFFSCHLGVAKPDREYFRHIQSSIGLSGPEILFVDDKRENVEGATGCGWNAAICRNAGELREVLLRHDLSTG